MRIRDFISTVKDSIELIKTIAIIGLFISSFFGAKSCQNIKDKYKQAESIITEKERLFTNEIGQKASEVKTLKLEYANLEKAAKNKDAEKTEYQKKLSKAYKDIELYKGKEKDLRAYSSFNLKARDTIKLLKPIPCEPIMPISTKHIDIFFMYNDSSEMNGIYYDYHTDINTLVTLRPKRKENGKKHFPNWGNLPWVGWDKISITTVEDSCARIDNQVSIEFKK